MKPVRPWEIVEPNPETVLSFEARREATAVIVVAPEHPCERHEDARREQSMDDRSPRAHVGLRAERADGAREIDAASSEHFANEVGRLDEEIEIDPQVSGRHEDPTKLLRGLLAIVLARELPVLRH